MCTSVSLSHSLHLVRHTPKCIHAMTKIGCGCKKPRSHEACDCVSDYVSFQLARMSGPFYDGSYDIHPRLESVLPLPPRIDITKWVNPTALQRRRDETSARLRRRLVNRGNQLANAGKDDSMVGEREAKLMLPHSPCVQAMGL